MPRTRGVPWGPWFRVPSELTRRPRRAWRSLRLALATSLCAGSLACWREVTVQTVRVVPGPFRLPGVTQLTLGTFEGPGGEQMAAAVARELLQQGCFAVRVPAIGAQAAAGGRATHGAAPSFVPADAAYGLGAAGGPRAAAASLLPGAEATFLARVGQNELEEEEEGDGGGWADASDVGGAVTRGPRRRIRHLQVALRAVDPHTGTLIDARSFTVHHRCSEQVARRDRAPDGPHPPVEPPTDPQVDTRRQAVACSAAYDELARQVASAVALHQEAVDVALFHLPGDAASTRALEAARRGDWLLAALWYHELTAELDARPGADDAARAMAHYDLGVAWAYGGALARGAYELCWSQALADTPAVRIELARVRGWRREADGAWARPGSPLG